MMSQAVAQMAKNPADACLDLTDPMNAEKEIIQRGVIINTASVAAFDGQIGQAAYSASKVTKLFFSLIFLTRQTGRHRRPHPSRRA